MFSKVLYSSYIIIFGMKTSLINQNMNVELVLTMLVLVFVL